MAFALNYSNLSLLLMSCHSTFFQLSGKRRNPYHHTHTHTHAEQSCWSVLSARNSYTGKELALSVPHFPGGCAPQQYAWMCALCKFKQMCVCAVSEWGEWREEGEIFTLPKAHTENQRDYDTVIAPPGPLWVCVHVSENSLAKWCVFNWMSNLCPLCLHSDMFKWILSHM